jgi:ribose transport system ATP-binding protein
VSSAPEPLLAIRGLAKSFGAVRVLSRVDLEVQPGEVHAVVGENGAGKSTLMKLLAGLLQPDQGEIRIAGALHAPRDPEAARRAGIALVPQEPEVVPHLTVAENLLLGSEPARFGFIDRKALRERALAALREVDHPGASLDPARLAGELPTSERQRVVIARALAQTAPRVVVFDEPTSSLTGADVERLFDIIERLRARGLAILYVSHFLEEVMRVAQRFTVLRDGGVVSSGPIAETTPRELVAAMAGESVAERTRRSPRSGGRVVLSLSDLAGKTLPRRASLELRAGEVLGLAGLVGAGRTELLRAVFGLDAVMRGELRVGAFIGPASPAARLASGVGLLSEDRKGEGLAGALSIAENLTLSRLVGSERLGRWPLVSPRRTREVAVTYVDRLGIRCRAVDQPVSELSGGNQQKVALARLLHHDVDVLLLDEPTRGIDVRSRLDVHRTIDELVEKGKAVLMVSSYLPELLTTCDRIAVMRRGELGPARPAIELDEHTILLEAAHP